MRPGGWEAGGGVLGGQGSSAEEGAEARGARGRGPISSCHSPYSPAEADVAITVPTSLPREGGDQHLQKAALEREEDEVHSSHAHSGARLRRCCPPEGLSDAPLPETSPEQPV